MKTFLTLENTPQETLPKEFEGPDIRFAPALAHHFLAEFTSPGDVVFDPFAGFGTTLRVAESLGREGRGIEFNARRCRYAQSFLARPERLLPGDSRRLSSYDLPPIDFSLTSPPYMNKNDREDPFSDYRSPGTGYAAYLRTLRDIYRQLGKAMKTGARAVIEIANLKGKDGVTTLAWDAAAAIGEVLRFEGEVVVAWEPTYAYGYDHSYCLVFGRK